MSRMKGEEKLKVKVDELANPLYSHILCYPQPEKRELKRRIEELKSLGVETVEFAGDKNVSGIPVLGKGCVGIVIAVYLSDERKAALKIRRVDADRANMQHEAEMLRKANSVHVGPKLLGFTENFILMQHIDGKLLPEWLDTAKNRSLAKRVLKELLLQCFRLDEIGLDHGELSNAAKHVIIDFEDVPFIIDFETASDRRRPANLTSLAQYLFIRKPIADKTAAITGKIDGQKLIEALRKYKMQKIEENFRKVLEACSLSL